VTTIRVELVEATSQATLGVVDLPAEQLPESFDASTTLHLGDAEWHVVAAEPMTRAEYAACGTLRLMLHKIELVDPKTILFSLPTIENQLPPLGPGAGPAACMLHEDDWRQRELVSARLEPEIAAELADIRKIHEGRTGPGFKTIHVRSRIPEPLGGRTVALADLVAALGNPERADIALGGGVVTGGFAFAIAGGHVYGREDGGLVVTLALAPGTDPAAISAFAPAHQLVLVEWCPASVERF